MEILLDDITAGSTPMGPPGGVTAATAPAVTEAALGELGINTAAPAPAAPDVAASASDASASDGEGDAGDSMQRGGIVKAPKDSRRRTTVHGGEFVVNRRATDAHRRQLEAWNRQGRRRCLAAA